MTDIQAMACKLLEALIEPCSQPDNDDHSWRLCRRCAAEHQLTTAPDVTRLLLSEALLALRQPALPTDAEVEQWFDDTNLDGDYPTSTCRSNAVRQFLAWLRTRAEERA